MPFFPPQIPFPFILTLKETLRSPSEGISLLIPTHFWLCLTTVPLLVISTMCVRGIFTSFTLQECAALRRLFLGSALWVSFVYSETPPLPKPPSSCPPFPQKEHPWGGWSRAQVRDSHQTIHHNHLPKLENNSLGLSVHLHSKDGSIFLCSASCIPKTWWWRSE